MLLMRLIVGAFAVVTVFAVHRPPFAAAQTLEVVRCSVATANPTCTVEVDRESPATTLPIRMQRGAVATIEVSKRPAENIQMEATASDVASPDPIAAIFTAFLPSLSKIVFRVSSVVPSDLRELELREPGFRVLAMSLPDPYASLLARLACIIHQCARSRWQESIWRPRGPVVVTHGWRRTAKAMWAGAGGCRARDRRVDDDTSGAPVAWGGGGVCDGYAGAAPSARASRAQGTASGWDRGKCNTIRRTERTTCTPIVISACRSRGICAPRSAVRSARSCSS